MAPLFGLVVAAVAWSVAYLVHAERQREHRRIWRLAAERAGLTAVEERDGGIFTGGSVAGRSGGLQVRLEPYRRGRYEHGTQIVITGLGHGAGGLSLRREGLSTAFEKRFVGEREIEIGDRLFDDECYVQGHPALAFALLSPETRPRLAELLGGCVSVAGGGSQAVSASLGDDVLQVQIKESGFSRGPEHVPEILAGVLDLAHRLVMPGDLAVSIAENLRSEYEPDARLKGLLTLAREFPRHPAAREALLAARQDPSPELRLRAGAALGEEGWETLLALVQDPSAGDSCVARAIVALGSHLPAERAAATLREALAGDGRAETAQACLEALARLGRSEAEGPILEALRSADPRITKAAARALGRVGTVAAVSALRAAMPPHGGLPQSVGRQAIAEIQARITGAGPGQLSLAAGEAGALSLADGAPGRLTLTEEEDARALAPEPDRRRVAE